ncbi:MAG: hypothetical protein IPP88_07055 [Betaproteobacteria bacterium]|nr:hypothetical protein [Betaproteobacteria bacterium]
MKIRPLLFACALSTLTAALQVVAQTPATPPAPAAPAAATVPNAVPAPGVPGAAAVPPAPPAIVYKEGVIKVGTEMKQSLGVLTDTDKGDNGCYVTFKDEKGAEFIELGRFELCSLKPPLKGKKVALAYSVETIQAASCYGDPKCKKTETVPLIVGIKVVE